MSKQLFAEEHIRTLLSNHFNCAYAAGQCNVKGWSAEELRMMKAGKEAEAEIMRLMSEVTR